MTTKRKPKTKKPEEYNKKYDNIFAKAKLMGYNSVGEAMVNPEFVEHVRSIKNKSYKFEPNKEESNND